MQIIKLNPSQISIVRSVLEIEEAVVDISVFAESKNEPERTLEIKLKEKPKDLKTVSGFFKELTPINSHPVNEVYQDYLNWCEKNQKIPMKKVELSRQIYWVFNMVSTVVFRNGKSVRVFKPVS